MRELDLITRVTTLKPLFEEACRTPFPYEGLRQLLGEAEATYDGLIPDLDMYFSTIAGYCSWGSRLLKWDNEKVDQVIANLESGFFEKHPRYKPLESIITQPDLVAKLNIYETMRVELRHLLKCLQKERAS